MRMIKSIIKRLSKLELAVCCMSIICVFFFFFIAFYNPVLELYEALPINLEEKTKAKEEKARKIELNRQKAIEKNYKELEYEINTYLSLYAEMKGGYTDIDIIKVILGHKITINMTTDNIREILTKLDNLDHSKEKLIGELYSANNMYGKLFNDLYNECEIYLKEYNYMTNEDEQKRLMRIRNNLHLFLLAQENFINNYKELKK